MNVAPPRFRDLYGCVSMTAPLTQGTYTRPAHEQYGAWLHGAYVAWARGTSEQEQIDEGFYDLYSVLLPSGVDVGDGRQLVGVEPKRFLRFLSETPYLPETKSVSMLVFDEERVMDAFTLAKSIVVPAQALAVSWSGVVVFETRELVPGATGDFRRMAVAVTVSVSCQGESLSWQQLHWREHPLMSESGPQASTTVRRMGHALQSALRDSLGGFTSR